jgi:hypothetical protein
MRKLGGLTSVIQYEWPGFHVTYCRITGQVQTSYPGFMYSRVAPDETDQFHAEKLKLCTTASIHKLAHELGHHILAIYSGLDTSPIIWRSAHHVEHPEAEWRDEERGVNALVYYAFGWDREEDKPSLEWMERNGIDVDEMSSELQWLLDLARLNRNPSLSKVSLG